MSANQCEMYLEHEQVGFMRDNQLASYESYLMRLRWVEAEEEEQLACQIMLQNVATKERHFFKDLDSVSAFLKAQVEQPR